MKPRPATAADPRPPAVGVIRGDEVYRLQEFQRRFGWREHAVRQARAAGLRMISFGREKYILGADVLAFFRGLSDSQSEGRQRSAAENKTSDGHSGRGN